MFVRLAKPVAVTLATLWAGMSHAANYYIDSVNGNDAWSGTQATASANNGPWQSLDRLKSVTLQPGDWVYLACGSKWNQTLPLSGTKGRADLGIMVTSYPLYCTNRPTISGYETLPLHAWKIDKDNIFQASLPYNRIANGAMARSIDGWKTFANDQSITARHSTACAGNVPCLLASSGNTGTRPRLVISPTFLLEAGKNYVLEASVFAPSGMNYDLTLRRNGPSFEATAPNFSQRGTGNWQTLRIPFTASRTADNARLELMFQSANTSIQLRDVKLALDSSEQLHSLRFGGFPRAVAHHPNAGHDIANPNSVYLRTARGSNIVTGPDGKTGSPSIHAGDLKLPPGGAITPGLNVHIRTAGWRVDPHKVTSISGSEIKLDTLTVYPIFISGWGFYFTGASWMLDSPGEWHYDNAGRTLRFWAPDDGHPTNQAQVSSLDNGIVLDNSEYVYLHGISVEGTREAISMRHTRNVTVAYVNVSDTVENGLTAVGSNGSSVIGSRFFRTGSDAIFALFTDKFTADSNVVEQSGLVKDDQGKISSLPKTVFSAIRGGTNARILRNEITDVSYIGIFVDQNGRIERNSITDVCLVLNDCGAIYLHHQSDNTNVYYNLIDRGVGNMDGNNPLLVPHSAGLYFDEHAHDITAFGNTIANHGYGAQVHNSWNISLLNNTFYGNRELQVFLQEQRKATREEGDTHSNRLEGNNFMPLNENNAVYLLGKTSTTYDFSSFKDNRYSTIFSPIVALENQPGNIRSAYDLLDWQKASLNGQPRGLDANSSISAYLPGRAIGKTQPTIIYNGDMSAGKASWYSSTTSGAATVIEATNCESSNGPKSCLSVTTGGGMSSVGTPRFSIEARWYRVTFDVRAEEENTSVWALVRRAGINSSASLMQSIFGVTAGKNWKRYTFMFKSTDTVKVDGSAGILGARLDFEQLPGGGKKLWLANVEMVPIDLELPLDTQLLKNSDTQHEAQLDCPVQNSAPELCTHYIGFPDGSPISWPHTLPPGGSKVVYTYSFKLNDKDQDGIWDGQDNCPDTPRLEPVNAAGCSFRQKR